MIREYIMSEVEVVKVLCESGLESNDRDGMITLLKNNVLTVFLYGRWLQFSPVNFRPHFQSQG